MAPSNERKKEDSTGMKGTLSLNGKPLAQLDEVTIAVFKTYAIDPIRVSYTSKALGIGKVFPELQRTKSLELQLDDGSQASVVFQHASLDAKGQQVGVLRVIGDFESPDPDGEE